jgi:hypothetical protein
MPASPDHTTLAVLARRASDRHPEPIILLPQAPGSGVDVIARSLIAGLGDGNMRLLAAPGPHADVLVQRAWHRDAWLAMPALDRDAVVLVTGATAGYLGPVLADSARTVVLVREPLAAISLTGEVLPKKRVLERLAESSHDVPPKFHRLANPQSRALLAPWHDPAELIVSPGPPSDADRWRDALFGDVLPHLDAAAIGAAPTMARDLAKSLGARPKPVVRAARAVLEDENQQGRAEDSASLELLLRFNWLDAELYRRCLGSKPSDPHDRALPGAPLAPPHA